LLLARIMEAHWRVKFTGGSGPAALVGSRPVVAAATRRQCPHDWERQPDPPRSHSCRACHVGPPVTEAIGTVAPPC
jgi:hypothetical protein